MVIGSGRPEVLDAGDRSRFAQDLQFLPTFEIVADIVVEDVAVVVSGFGTVFYVFVRVFACSCIVFHALHRSRILLGFSSHSLLLR